MVLGYHLIFSAYGFWLPNDPRGSNSTDVRKPQLREFGEATTVTTRASVARRPHDRALRLAAKQVLALPPVLFTGIQARAVARGFGNYVAKSGVTVWACAVMPDHFHLVIARHTYDVEVMGDLLKGEATKQLNREGIHPFRGRVGPKKRAPSCFGRKWRAVFLDTEDDILRSIRYVEKNPMKAGYKPQAWPFVVKYPERYQQPERRRTPPVSRSPQRGDAR